MEEFSPLPALTGSTPNGHQVVCVKSLPLWLWYALSFSPYPVVSCLDRLPWLGSLLVWMVITGLMEGKSGMRTGTIWICFNLRQDTFFRGYNLRFGRCNCCYVMERGASNTLVILLFVVFPLNVLHTASFQPVIPEYDVTN